jgi:alkylation response protein AidB-like acyl-CoA dehydrogenase
MKQENYFTANRDLVFQFEKITPWAELAELAEGGFQDPDGPANAEEAIDLYREALTLAGEYAGHELAARARAVDEAGSWHRDGPVAISEPLRQNIVGLTELGLTGISVPRRYGGENFPFTATAMLLEILARACPTTMVQYAFYMSPALMLLRFAPEHLKQQYIPRLARGEISGAVAMTEPQAGSDVGRIMTTATSNGDGWVLNGRKQFITNGCGDFAIVLARSEPGSQGLDGLSLFLAERVIERDGRTIDNYVVERAENKVCIAGSPTCGLVFDGTEAVLLGQRGGGWQEIVTFMNESRVGVGVQGLGTAQAAFEEARAYAAERVQMGRPIREHPLVADMLLDMEATIAGLRALAYEATVAYDRVEGLKRQKDSVQTTPSNSTDHEATIKRQAAYLRELTPLVKYFGAEEVIRIARLALQTFGGYGVIKDYDIERIFRDTLILSIYEGTSQIQALMAVKDLLKVIMRRPASLIDGTFSPSLARTSTRDDLGRMFRKARNDFNWSVRYILFDLIRHGGVDLLRDLLRGKAAMDEDDIAYILLNAERLTIMLSHLHASRLLLEQARRFPERRSVAARMLQRTMLVCQTASRQVRSGERSTLETVERWRQERGV